MDKLGIVLHISGSRKIILRTKIKVKTGINVLNEELNSVGRIIDIFGPIRNPYVSIEPIIDAPQRYIGRAVYIMEKNGKG